MFYIALLIIFTMNNEFLFRSVFPPRSKSSSVMAKGFFPGAKVKVGPDCQLKGTTFNISCCCICIIAWMIADGDQNAVGEILNSDSKSFVGCQ